MAASTPPIPTVVIHSGSSTWVVFAAALGGAIAGGIVQTLGGRLIERRSMVSTRRHEYWLSTRRMSIAIRQLALVLRQEDQAGEREVTQAQELIDQRYTSLEEIPKSRDSLIRADFEGVSHVWVRCVTALGSIIASAHVFGEYSERERDAALSALDQADECCQASYTRIGESL